MPLHIDPRVSICVVTGVSGLGIWHSPSSLVGFTFVLIDSFTRTTARYTARVPSFMLKVVERIVQLDCRTRNIGIRSMIAKNDRIFEESE